MSGALKPEVTGAIEEIQRTFPGNKVEVVPDGQGGAAVFVDALDVSPAFTPASTWVGFHIPFQYPYADIYPHFVRSDLERAGVGGLAEAMSQASFQGRSAIQISRRSNRRDAERDTAALKLLRIVEWLRTRR